MPERPPIGILSDIAQWQRRERARGVVDPQLEPELPAGAEWLGSRLEPLDRVLVWRVPDGTVVEQRMPLLNLGDREQARRMRAAFRLVREQ